MSGKNLIKDQVNMGIETYMEKRVNDQIEWMSNKSAKFKSKYMTLKLLIIILSVSIPILVMFIDVDPRMKYLVALAGAMIAAIEGFLSLYDYQNNWINYRSTVETLKREQFLFATKTNIYKTADDASSLFVERVENILNSENKNWVKFSEDEPSISKGKKA